MLRKTGNAKHDWSAKLRNGPIWLINSVKKWWNWITSLEIQVTWINFCLVQRLGLFHFLIRKCDKLAVFRYRKAV